jgi:chromosome segregation ATPase
MGLKDLFIKRAEEKEPEKPPASGAGAAGPVLFPGERQTVPASSSSDLETGPFLEQLKEAMQKADLPGQQTYLAFSKALENMEKLPMDEATKFKAAFATLQATGCDVSQLVESFSYFEGILDTEKDRFEEALHATIGDSVVTQENEIKKLTDENTDLSSQIQKLTEKITANQQAVAHLQAGLADAREKMKRKEASFMAAYQAMKDRLQVDARKIDNYLGAGITAQAHTTTKHKK